MTCHPVEIMKMGLISTCKIEAAEEKASLSIYLIWQYFKCFRNIRKKVFTIYKIYYNLINILSYILNFLVHKEIGQNNSWKYRGWFFFVFAFPNFLNKTKQF